MINKIKFIDGIEVVFFNNGSEYEKSNEEYLNRLDWSQVVEVTETISMHRDEFGKWKVRFDETVE